MSNRVHKWRERLAEIDATLAAATTWGALLTALIEERKAILFNLYCHKCPRKRYG